MRNISQYVLVENNCDLCHFVKNVFAFLKLPLQTINLDQLTKMSKPNHCILCCPEVEQQAKKLLYDFINLHAIQLISFLEKNKEHQTLLTLPYYLSNPFSTYELNQVLAAAAHGDQGVSQDENAHPCFESLLGQSKEIRTIRSLISQVATSDCTVLILGQSGTGKDVVASCIHYASQRKSQPFVPINCGAIPSELMESELFGHEKGAFTGAATRRIGRFEMAHKGTLFLDEIGDMPMPMQVKLLRVLQERKFERVGGNESIKVDVRIIAATNKNLEQLIQDHHFREDLFYRLNVFPIQLPTLKERAEDIPALIDYHMEKIYRRLNHKIIFTDTAKQALCQYGWPGNIRELENYLERMVIIHRDQVLSEQDLDLPIKHNATNVIAKMKALFNSKENNINIKEYVANIERVAIEFSLEHSNGMIEAAASYLSLAPKVLLEKMKKYKVGLPSPRSSANSGRV